MKATDANHSSTASCAKSVLVACLANCTARNKAIATFKLNATTHAAGNVGSQPIRRATLSKKAL